MVIIAEVIYSEPITLLSDGLLALQALLYAIFLYRIFKQKGLLAKRWPWIAMYLATFIFAASGSISHGTNNLPLRIASWPPVIIGGIFMLYFFQKACVFELLPNIADQPRWHKIYAYILLICFQLLGYLMDWGFWVFGVYLLIMVGEILWRCRPSVNIHQPESIKAFVSQLRIYFFIIIILVVIQAVGSIAHWMIYFGSNPQYLLLPHNEIFHFGALFTNHLLYHGLVKLCNC